MKRSKKSRTNFKNSPKIKNKDHTMKETDLEKITGGARPNKYW